MSSSSWTLPLGHRRLFGGRYCTSTSPPRRARYPTQGQYVRVRKDYCPQPDEGSSGRRKAGRRSEMGSERRLVLSASATGPEERLLTPKAYSNSSDLWIATPRQAAAVSAASGASYNRQNSIGGRADRASRSAGYAAFALACLDALEPRHAYAHRSCEVANGTRPAACASREGGHNLPYQSVYCISRSTAARVKCTRMCFRSLSSEGIIARKTGKRRRKRFGTIWPGIRVPAAATARSIHCRVRFRIIQYVACARAANAAYMFDTRWTRGTATSTSPKDLPVLEMTAARLVVVGAAIRRSCTYSGALSRDLNPAETCRLKQF